MPTGGQKTPIEPGLIARAVQGVQSAVRSFVAGVQSAFMGPSDPIAPTHDAPQEQTKGRQFDYPAGFNTRIRPRSEEAVTFAQMRALADGYDLLRLVIETRKDQLSKMKWGFKPTDTKAKPDSRVDALTAFFKMPDQEHCWDDWLRMLVEEMLVTDAATIYPRMTVGGDLYSFDLMDGSLIKRVIDGFGRTPLPPDPAYQQVLKGVPAVDYTKDELVYRPRNLRVHKIYGYSPVEQVIMTVNIALRRQLNQLSYYTEGNVPNLIFGVPETWSMDQIKLFQTWWDSLMAGQTKHVGKFVPGGIVPHDTKPAALKDEYDEWLARIVCFAFSIAPTPFIKSNNRSVADNAKEQALQEGLAPVMQWVKNLIDYLLVKYFQITDLEFTWLEEEALDPVDQAEVLDLKVRNGILSLNEARAKDGDDAIPGGDVHLIYTSAGAVTLDSVLNPPPPPAPVVVAPPAGAPGANDEPPPEPAPATPEKKTASARGSLAKIKKVIRPIDRDRQSVNDARAELTTILTTFLKAQAGNIAEQLGEALGLAKVDEPSSEDQSDRALDSLDFTDWQTAGGSDSLIDQVRPLLVKVAVDGGQEALNQVGMLSDEVQDLMSENATEWASQRAAEMVGMKYNEDGELEPNPDARWQITEGTRERLRSLTTQAVDEGWSNDQLASAIGDSEAFSEGRAEMIARTETANADVQGNIEGWRASDQVEGKEWSASPGCCDLCQEMDKIVVGLEEEFPNDGGDGPPLHPRCECDVLPVLKEDSE